MCIYIYIIYPYGSKHCLRRYLTPKSYLKYFLRRYLDPQGIYIYRHGMSLVWDEIWAIYGLYTAKWDVLWSSKLIFMLVNYDSASNLADHSMMG